MQVKAYEMTSFNEFKKNLHSIPSDCTGIDIGASVTKVIRLKAVGNKTTILGAELINRESTERITIPQNLRARYASISTSCANAIIKIVTFPGAPDASSEKMLPQKLGINQEDDYRISHIVISEGHARTESRFLAAAIPEEDAKPIMQLFSSGIPVPYSLELTPISTLTAFEHNTVSTTQKMTTGLIDFGTNETYLSVFHKKKLILMRKFDFGTNLVMEHLKSTLRISSDIAHGMLDDASFDISDMLGGLMSSVASDLTISLDFIQRDKSCKVDHLFAIGGIAQSKAALETLKKSMSIDIKPWNPLDGMNISSSIDAEIKKQHWRFAGALGAALATLEEK